VIRISPPLTVDSAAIDDALAIFRESFAAME
jgi:4-aminobutyrate aminotransferase-like enzyme